MAQKQNQSPPPGSSGTNRRETTEVENVNVTDVLGDLDSALADIKSDKEKEAAVLAEVLRENRGCCCC